MASTKSSLGYGFGTASVFLAAISTILGAILFLRFGYAVGHTGLLGFSLTKLAQEQGDFFKRFENIKDILFVRAGQKIVISE